MTKRSCKPWIVEIKEGRFTDGWNEFARAHDLQFGDLLVFRHQGDSAFQVHVFDTTACEKAYPPSHAAVANAKKKNNNKKKISKDVSSSLKRTTQDMEETPKFTMVIRPTNLKWHRMLIPLNFAKENNLTNIFEAFPAKSCPVTLKIPNGKSWMVNLNYSPSSHSIYIRRGWDKFRIANKLKVGDVCTFKLVSSGVEHIVMEVSISRSKSSNPKPKPIKPPQFRVTLKAYNFNWGGLYIPATFGRKNGLVNSFGWITLKDPQGRSWKVNLKGKHGKAQLPCILGGWPAFSHANKLKVGDLCTFKLVSRDSRNIVMEVSVSRSNRNLKA